VGRLRARAGWSRRRGNGKSRRALRPEPTRVYERGDKRRTRPPQRRERLSCPRVSVGKAERVCRPWPENRQDSPLLEVDYDPSGDGTKVLVSATPAPTEVDAPGSGAWQAECWLLGSGRVLMEYSVMNFDEHGAPVARSLSRVAYGFDATCPKGVDFRAKD
jgi:hypothetical protein